MFKTYDLIGNVLVANGTDSAKIHVYVNPDANERQTILRTTNLDEHSLSSALDPDEVSRVEFKPEHTFIIWKRPENYSFQEHVGFNVTSVGLVLTNDRLTIILGEDIGLANGKQPQHIDAVADIVLNLFSQTTRHFLEHLKVIKQISREVQQKINTALENEYLIQMFSLGESLTYYLNAINSNSVVLTKIRNHTDKVGLSPAQVEFLDDVMIENNQCLKQAEIYSSILSGLMDARGTLVNNNMNVILKNLTIINTVFLPLNLIASIGGMSEFSMMTKGTDWRVTYLLFLVAMVALGWLTTLFIHKFSWWQKKRG